MYVFMNIFINVYVYVHINVYVCMFSYRYVIVNISREGERASEGERKREGVHPAAPAPV
jgi:hypothetical protein